MLRVAFFVVAACCLDGCLYPQNKKEKLLLQPSNHPTSHQRSRSGALTIFNAKASAGGWIMIMVVVAVDGFKGGRWSDGAPYKLLLLLRLFDRSLVEERTIEACYSLTSACN